MMKMQNSSDGGSASNKRPRREARKAVQPETSHPKPKPTPKKKAAAKKKPAAKKPKQVISYEDQLKVLTVSQLHARVKAKDPTLKISRWGGQACMDFLLYNVIPAPPPAQPPAPAPPAPAAPAPPNTPQHISALEQQLLLIAEQLANQAATQALILERQRLQDEERAAAHVPQVALVGGHAPAQPGFMVPGNHQGVAVQQGFAMVPAAAMIAGDPVQAAMHGVHDYATILLLCYLLLLIYLLFS
jgi:hypothetical protein